jgi:hypothetical protein
VQRHKLIDTIKKMLKRTNLDDTYLHRISYEVNLAASMGDGDS